MTLGAYVMSDVERSKYPLLALQCHREGKAYIYPAQLDAGLRFPFCTDLKMCQFYHLSSMNMSPFALRSWVGFQVLYVICE